MPRLAPEPLELGLAQELGDRRAHLAVGTVDEVREALRAPLLRDLLELREVAARELPRHAEEPHGGGVGEHLEGRPARHLGRLLDLEPEAQVGLVGAVAEVGLLPRQPPERQLELDVAAFAPDAGHDPLDQAEQVLPVGEGRLDVELGDLLQPVGAQVLVPEAAGDLVVALEAGDHEQLLVDLRALRQREEAARLQASRDEEVASALGRRLAHDRRLDVDEAVGLHLGADDRDELRAGADVALHLLAAQVEPAVAEPDRLVDALLVELERKRGRARQDLELVRLHLDLAGRHGRVDRRRRAADDAPARPDHELVAQCLGRLRRRGRVLGVDHDLEQALLVAKVDEDEPAVVAAGRHPAGNGDGAPLVLGPKRASAEVAPDTHRLSVAGRSASGTTCSAAPGRLTTASPALAITIVRAPVRPGLGQLPLERTSGVVGVAGEAAASQLCHQRQDLLPGGAVDGEEDVEARRLGRDPLLLEREQQPLETGAEADPRRRRPADLLDQAVVAAAAGRSSSSRSRRARRTRTSSASSSRARARASARRCRERRTRRGGCGRRRSARRTRRRATRRSSAPRPSAARTAGLLTSNTCNGLVPSFTRASSSSASGCASSQSFRRSTYPGRQRGIADRVQHQLPLGHAEPAQELGVELDHLGVDGRVRRADRLDRKLPVLAVAAPAGGAVAVHRARSCRASRAGARDASRARRRRAQSAPSPRAGA